MVRSMQNTIIAVLIAAAHQRKILLAARLKNYFLIDLDLSQDAFIFGIEVIHRLDIYDVLQSQGQEVDFVIKDIREQGISLCRLREQEEITLFIPMSNIKCLHNGAQWLL